MKQWIKRVLLGGAALLAAIGCVMFYFEQTATTPPVSTDMTLHLPPAVCSYMFNGVTPEEFCANRGADTVLRDAYVSAEVDKDGCLILILEEAVAEQWKNSLVSLQILQCVLGDSRDIGVTVDYSNDYLGFMENAHTCGFEIAEDYTKIIDEYGDNTFYLPEVMIACLEMQVFAGKTCENIIVEYLRYDKDGEVADHVVYPDYVTQQ